MTQCRHVGYGFVLVLFACSLSLGGMLANFGMAQSHSLGMFAAVLPIIIVSLESGHFRWIYNSDVLFLSTVLLLILVHFFVSVATFGFDYYVNIGGFSRFFLSLFFFLVIVWAAIQVERFLSALSEVHFVRIIKLFHLLLVFLVLVSAPFHFLDLVSRKQMFFFSEPSHFALIFGAFGFYMILNSSRPFLLFLFYVALALVLKNMIFLVFSFAAYFLSFRLKGSKLVAGISVVIAFSFLFFYLFQGSENFVVERLALSTESENLSVLVFLSGYERALLTVSEWSLFGVGFQQMGLAGPMGNIQGSIEAIVGVPMNIMDGGSLFAKMVTEFGVLGLALIGFYCLSGLRLMNRISKGNSVSHLELFYICCVLWFFAAIFLRAVGYFSPSVFIFFVGVVGLIRLRSARLASRRVS